LGSNWAQIFSLNYFKNEYFAFIRFSGILHLFVFRINAMLYPLVTPTQMGQILKTARKASQLSQGELASRVGLSQSRISVFEQQPENISLGQLMAVLNVLGLELSVQSRQAATIARDTDTPEW
jgi:HTH-type transcriptional regulator/antitoxin HipB